MIDQLKSLWPYVKHGPDHAGTDGTVMWIVGMWLWWEIWAVIAVYFTALVVAQHSVGYVGWAGAFIVGWLGREVLAAITGD